MDAEFKPSSILTTITVITFSGFALMPTIAGMFILTFIIALPAVVSTMSFIYKYRKYIVTDTSLKVVNWNDRITSQTDFRDIRNIYFHKGTMRTGGTMQVDQPVETMLIDLNSGETLHIDLTPVDNSDELVALLKSKIAV